MAEQLTFQFEDGGSIPTSPLQLEIKEISWRLFKECNMAWHSRLPKPGGFYINGMFFGAFHKGMCLAVAGWSNPIARRLNGRNWYELRRMAISPNMPKNTASRMLSIMIKIIKKTKHNLKKLISYQDVSVHAGTIYKAAGWHSTPYIPGSRHRWLCHSRPSAILQTMSIKIRWECDL